MSGAWEVEAPSVMVVVISGKELVPIKWAYSMRNLRLPGQHTIHTLAGMTYDHARNEGVKAMLNGGFQWLFFIDDDVCVPADAFEKLSRHGLDIVSGVYYRRSPPIGHPVMLKETPQGATFIDKYTVGDMVEADLVGAGCLLIHRRVLENLAQPLGNRWFQWMMETAPAGEKCSEDFFFCRMARRAGFRVVVDTSVQCEHLGIASSNISGYGPMQV